MSKIERNMPCPCGSGKKYKRCCGSEGTIGVTPAFGKSESEGAVALLLDMMSSPGFAGTLARAQAEFVGDAFASAEKEQIRAALEHEQTELAFNTWLLFDAYITEDRHRLMEVLAGNEWSAVFTPGQRRFLDRMAASHMRPYEVREVRRDEGFVLKDLWTEGETTVSERAATHFLERGEMFFARVIEGPRGAAEMHGAVLVLMPLAMQDLLAAARVDSGEAPTATRTR